MMKTNAFSLLSLYFTGFISLVLLFAVCFFGVHVCKLVLLGWEHQKKKQPTPPQKAEEKTEEKTPEPIQPNPVYYIVEKKKQRAKTTYSKPKEFKFK